MIMHTKRAIVFHGAKYVDPNYISRLGYIGRSQGCPAVSSREATPIINTIKEGTCLFIYSANAILPTSFSNFKLGERFYDN